MLNAPALARFRELETSHAPSVAIDHLRRIVAEGSDFDCYKLNAFRLAAELGLTRQEMVRALLFATRIGIFDLNWDIHCPSCMGLPEYHRHLMKLDRRAHCALCDIDWDLDFTEQVEVTFTVNPDVRAIAYVDQRDRPFPATLEALGESLHREGRDPICADCLNPGEVKAWQLTLDAGTYQMIVPSCLERSGRITVAGAPTDGEQVALIAVDETGAVTPRELTLRPGRVAFTVHYGFPRFWGFHILPQRELKNWVSAAYITSQQDFRDLFSGEFLADDSSFAVRSTTLMFTDIRGSTELYEALGDAAAYKVVQDHFRLMTEIIRQHEGGIVKTIGDAVMASFPRNLDAVRAACHIQRDFTARSGEMRNIEVKIGLHRGPAIAVTSNRSLDFFGRTVNLAARVQSKSKPREILLTDSVLSDPAVTAFLDEKHLAREPFQATLKGLAGTIQLSSIRPA